MEKREWFPASDSANVVGKFAKKSIIDVAKSREEDREIHTDIIVCHSKVKAGSDESVVPVKPHNRAQLIARFPEAWDAFEGGKPEVTGIPLETMDIPSDRIQLFKIQGIYSVDDLAVMSDAVAANCGFGAKTWREDAKKVIAAQLVDEKPRSRGRQRKERSE